MHPIPFSFIAIAVDADTMGFLEVAYTLCGIVYAISNTPFLDKKKVLFETSTNLWQNVAFPNSE